MSKSLLQKIAEIDSNVADRLEEGGLTIDDDLKDLCFEALKEIIPEQGMKGIVLRSRIWKVISQDNMNEVNATNCSKSASKPVAQKRKSRDITSLDDSDLSEDDVKITKATNSANQSSPSSPATLQVKSPTYTIYKDRRVDLAVKEGCIPDQLVHDIVRGTISNMMSASLSDPFNRLPSTIEIREMAKSLILTYPLLGDSVSGHEPLFNRLKKRMYNKKPIAKRRIVNKKEKIDTPNISNYFPKEPWEVIDDSESSNEEKKNAGISSSSCTSDLSLEETDSTEPTSSQTGIDQPIMSKLYSSLEKEMRKTKPSPMIVNHYLNKEFTSRRNTIKDMAVDERFSKVLKMYPCFKNHVEIVEEVRRIRREAARKSPEVFMKECVDRLAEELDMMIYYGSSKQSIDLPNKPGKVAKVIHLFKNLPLLFGNNNGKTGNSKSKKVVELIYMIKDHEDPQAVCGTKRHNGKTLPKLCLDKRYVYLVCPPGILILTLELSKILEAVLAFIGLFYLMDVDYPQTHELGLTMLHNIIFEDLNAPADIMELLKAAKESYLEFKKTASDI